MRYLFVSIYLPICKLSHEFCNKNILVKASFTFRDFLVPSPVKLPEDMSWRLWDVETTTELLLQDAGDRSWMGLRGWGCFFCCSCSCRFVCKKTKVGRKTHPKTLHAWIFLWFVWIRDFWGLDSVEICSQHIWHRESDMFSSLTAGRAFQAGLWWLSCKSCDCEFPTVIWYLCFHILLDYPRSGIHIWYIGIFTITYPHLPLKN